LASDMHGIAWSTWEMGDLERVAGNIDLAQNLFDQSWNLFEGVNDPNGFIFCQRGLGDVAQARGDFEGAEAKFVDSLRLAREQSHLWAAGYALSGIGRANLAMERFDMALENFLEAFRLNYDNGFYELAMIALVGLAGVLACTDRPEMAQRLSEFVLNQYLSWNETKGQAIAVREAAMSMLDSTKIKAAESWAAEATLEMLAGVVSSLLV
jgi:tetratricopeptide (TPR) repeat protein